MDPPSLEAGARLGHSQTPKDPRYIHLRQCSHCVTSDPGNYKGLVSLAEHVRDLLAKLPEERALDGTLRRRRSVVSELEHEAVQCVVRVIHRSLPMGRV